MGKSSGSAPSADPNIGKAALKQAETGEQWLKFAEESFAVSTSRQAELDALTKQITEQQIGIAGEQAGWSRDDRERYETVFKPIEDKFIEDATSYATPERQAAAAAEARGDVQMASAAEREAAQRRMMAVGINPDSGRYRGIDRAGELGTALNSAGAANLARNNVRDKGLALTADVANLGRGLPSQSAQAASVGLSAGNSAAGNAGAANQQFINSTGVMGQGYQGAMAGYGGQASTLNQLYNSQLNSWAAENQAQGSAIGGIASGLGTAAGMIWGSDENIKTDKKKLKEGAALEAVKDMRVEEWNYAPGVADAGRHIGTYAQDFKKSTGKGDGKTIAAQDAIGVTMGALKDLDRKVSRIAKAVEMKEAA